MVTMVTNSHTPYTLTTPSICPSYDLLPEQGNSPSLMLLNTFIEVYYTVVIVSLIY